MTGQRRQLHLMVSLQGSGYEPGSWRHSSAQPDKLHLPIYYQQLAQTAERGKLDLVYLDNPFIDPLTLMAAIVANTDRIGVGATVTTELIEPFAAARSLAALDHFSKGRSAWYAGTHSNYEPQRLNDRSSEWTPSQLLERNQEFIQVAEKLWDSWEADALLVDRAQGKYIDASRIHRINHEGKYYQVVGPLGIPRPPQGRPIRIGFTELEGAIGGADVVVTPRASLEEAIARKSSLHSGKLLTTIVPILAHTEVDARALASELRQYRTSKNNVQEDNLFVGTPTQLADWMEMWFTSGASDGFHIQPALLPLGLEDFVDQVIPLLQARGLFRTDYSSSTLRGHLDVPAERFSEEVTQ